jgi:hypothetical protein
MKEHYEYDEIYGSLLHKNEDDTEITYFIIECLTNKFSRWMFEHGWNKVGEKRCERNGLSGYKVTLVRSKNNPT